MVQAQD
jgi:chromosome segregation ATPase